MCNKRVPKVTYPHRAIFAPLAQLARASGLHPEGREFESLGEHMVGSNIGLVRRPLKAERRVRLPY